MSEGSRRGSERRCIDRRGALRRVGGAALSAVLPLSAGLPLSGLSAALAEVQEKGTAEKRKKRVLLFTRSQGFEHSVVKRTGNDLGPCEKVLVDLGPRHGFEVTATKDGRLFSDPANIACHDAFVFFTSGVLTKAGGDGQPPMSAEGKLALLEGIAGGKGFAAIHSANDSFHSEGDLFENQPEEKRDPYIRMLGGEFIVHGDQQEAVMKVVSPHFPGCEGLGPRFPLLEEWYTHKNFAPDMHVILLQETAGMKGDHYARPPYPATWARRHGKGRVFYTSMGHREEVWKEEKFLRLLLGGIAWALGEVEAEVPPNLAAAAPEALKLQAKPAK